MRSLKNILKKAIQLVKITLSVHIIHKIYTAHNKGKKPINLFPIVR